MEIVEYNETYRNLWEQFVDDSNNGTLFAYQKFFDYHPKDRFKHRHLMFFERGKLVAICPEAEVKRDDGVWLVSHPGASFDGIITSTRSGISEALKLVDALINFARQEGYKGIELTRPPWIYYKLPENHIDFALFVSGGIYKKRELTSVVRLYSSIDENLRLFKTTARTAMRKAKKSGVKIEITNKWDEFYTLLERNLKLRHGVKPTHTLSEIYKLTSLLPDKIILFGAFAEEKMIAGSTIFICNKQTLLSFYITQDYDHQNLRPLNLTFAEIMRWGIDRGYGWLDFGTYTLNNIPNLGLARFKESLGARGIFRDTIMLKL